MESTVEPHGDNDAVAEWKQLADRGFHHGDDPDSWREWHDEGPSTTGMTPSTDPILAMKFQTIHMAKSRREQWVTRRRWSLVALGSGAILWGLIWYLSGEPFLRDPQHRRPRDITPFWLTLIGSMALLQSLWTSTIAYAGEKFGGESYYRMRDEY